MNYGFIIDNRKCIGCHACTVACKAEHNVPVGVNRTWVKYIEKGEFPNTRRFFSVLRCNHCEDAPCVEICPVTALYIRSDGIVDFDNRRCIGCKSCMQACPYDALYIDPETNTAAKCNYCAHRIDIGLEPACVNVCPEHAIISGDLDNPNAEIALLYAHEQVTARKVEKGTGPKLFYIHGDEASLVPSRTGQSSQYLWSTQSSGVGHFAKFAQSLIAESNPVEMARQLSGQQDVPVTNGDSNSGTVSSGENMAMESGPDVNNARDENTRRVYDAPAKGVLWGWDVSAYVWTKAIAAGAFLVLFLASTLGGIQVSETVEWIGLGVSLFFLMLTGLFLVMDLDKPYRFLYVLLRPQWNSWLVRGGYAITFYGAFLTLWGLSKYFGWIRIGQVSYWASAILAVITGVYTAFLFAQARGRDFWQSPALPLHMLVQTLMAGAGVFAITGFVYRLPTGWQGFLSALLATAIISNLIILTVELMTTHSTADAKKTVEIIVSGKYSKMFWLGSVVAGNLLPLFLLWAGGSGWFALAGILTIFGIYMSEYIWVRTPQLIQLS